MHKVRVVIGRSSDDLMWKVLECFLKEVADIDVYSVELDSMLSRALLSLKPQVLILDENENSQIKSNVKRSLM